MKLTSIFLEMRSFYSNIGIMTQCLLYFKVIVRRMTFCPQNIYGLWCSLLDIGLHDKVFFPYLVFHILNPFTLGEPPES
jgi:hypothetical protein